MYMCRVVMLVSIIKFSATFWLPSRASLVILVKFWMPADVIGLTLPTCRLVKLVRWLIPLLVIVSLPNKFIATMRSNPIISVLTIGTFDLRILYQMQCGGVNVFSFGTLCGSTRSMRLCNIVQV